jgi:hypothetical protein
MIRTWLASVAIVGALAAPGIANATINDLTISGSLDGHSYTGTLSLDVTGGQDAAARLCRPRLCRISPGQDEPRKVCCLAPSNGCVAQDQTRRYAWDG